MENRNNEWMGSLLGPSSVVDVLRLFGFAQATEVERTTPIHQPHMVLVYLQHVNVSFHLPNWKLMGCSGRVVCSTFKWLQMNAPVRLFVIFLGCRNRSRCKSQMWIVDAVAFV